mmetsp:Transcript_61241/g.115449  ORF Transcript_61241/g.115449 Transcript_61241/m.115449 type:complete len:211 (-) Transcript_61241:8-640(-)
MYKEPVKKLTMQNFHLHHRQPGQGNAALSALLMQGRQRQLLPNRMTFQPADNRAVTQKLHACICRQAHASALITQELATQPVQPIPLLGDFRGRFHGAQELHRDSTMTQGVCRQSDQELLQQFLVKLFSVSGHVKILCIEPTLLTLTLQFAQRQLTPNRHRPQRLLELSSLQNLTSSEQAKAPMLSLQAFNAQPCNSSHLFHSFRSLCEI